jgi:hypothetical protein
MSGEVTDEDGSKECPFTRGGGTTFRSHKFCRCSKCNIVELCTPRRDFYVVGA